MEYNNYIKGLNEKQKTVLEDGKNYYELTFNNIGGLVMPVILKFEFVDGSFEEHHIPAEIWRKNSVQISKVFITEKEIEQIILDPYLETADTERENNYFPKQRQLSRFELYKSKPGRWDSKGENPMQRDQRAKSKEGTN